MTNNGNDENDDEDSNNKDPYALKFGVATRKDRKFYQSLEHVEEEGDEASSRDNGTFLMRSIPNLRHGDVIGVALQQSDLPMIQMLLNGEPLVRENSFNIFCSGLLLFILSSIQQLTHMCDISSDGMYDKSV